MTWACSTSTSAIESGATTMTRNLVFPFYVIPDEPNAPPAAELPPMYVLNEA